MIETAYCTDKGIQKDINQDKIYIKKGRVQSEEVVFAAVCDGMGGLSNGELASKEAVTLLDRWFQKELPHIIEKGLTNNTFRQSLNRYIVKIDHAIRRTSKGERSGTTLAGILLANRHYGIVNIGDSRVYHLDKNKIVQITEDQSVVQNLLNKGIITQEQAKEHPQKNVLLQCIGCGENPVPKYHYGNYEKGDIFILCSDGFRHKLTKEEMRTLFNPKEIEGEVGMQAQAEKAVNINMERGERDNISVIVIRL